MKIDRYQPVQPPYGNYSHQKAAEQQNTTDHRNDKVEISDAARRMQGAQKTDEARSQKVEQLKAQVQSGTYHVDSKDIAAKMYSFWNQK
ncbi:MAG: flagellar biosynthesis anti-sigma factor FlgM [Sporolactobacillus sp.]